MISQSFNTVIRLFFFIILFVKRATLCMCLSGDESIHSSTHSFTSHLPFLLPSASSFVPSTITTATTLYYPQLSQRKTVLHWFFFFLDSEGCSRSPGDQFQFWGWMDFSVLTITSDKINNNSRYFIVLSFFYVWNDYSVCSLNCENICVLLVIIDHLVRQSTIRVQCGPLNTDEVIKHHCN